MTNLPKRFFGSATFIGSGGHGNLTRARFDLGYDRRAIQTELILFAGYVEEKQALGILVDMGKFRHQTRS